MIHVSQPVLAGNEKQYVMTALERGQLSGGEFVARLEAAFAELLGVKHAVACSSGTAALHLALLAIGVQPGDEVIVPALTYIATANAVTYCGARPVFVDVDPETWTIDPDLAADAITERTVGILPVHLYGVPANMHALGQLAAQNSLFLVEDAAEALGAASRRQAVGTLGHAGIFSLYGNKTLSCGEGGLLVTNDNGTARRARLYRGQGKSPDAAHPYRHEVIGHNYRLGELAAAVALGQVEQAEWHVQRRRLVARWYRKRLREMPEVILQKSRFGDRPAWWMTALALGPDCADRQTVMDRLACAGIETRPTFLPLPGLPPYQNRTRLCFPTSESIGAQGLCLPSHAGLTEADVALVCERLGEALAT